jgi:lactobin A/cerein 7B family class IIb bacteriocin
MNTEEISGNHRESESSRVAAVRSVTATELEEVSGGFWTIVGRLAIGIGMALIENQQHNGSGSGTLNEGLHR